MFLTIALAVQGWVARFQGITKAASTPHADVAHGRRGVHGGWLSCRVRRAIGGSFLPGSLRLSLHSWRRSCRTCRIPHYPEWSPVFSSSSSRVSFGSFGARTRGWNERTAFGTDSQPVDRTGTGRFRSGRRAAGRRALRNRRRRPLDRLGCLGLRGGENGRLIRPHARYVGLSPR